MTTVQSNSIILFQDPFQIPAFCNYIRVHIYKTISPHEGNLRVKRIEISGTQFFVCILNACPTVGKPAPLDSFSEM